MSRIDYAGASTRAQALLPNAVCVFHGATQARLNASHVTWPAKYTGALCRHWHVTALHNGMNTGCQVHLPEDIVKLMTEYNKRHPDRKRNIHCFEYKAFKVEDYEELRDVAGVADANPLPGIDSCHQLRFTYKPDVPRAELTVVCTGLSDYKRPEHCTLQEFEEWVTFGTASAWGDPVREFRAEHKPFAPPPAAAAPRARRQRLADDAEPPEAPSGSALVRHAEIERRLAQLPQVRAQAGMPAVATSACLDRCVLSHTPASTCCLTDICSTATA